MIKVEWCENAHLSHLLPASTNVVVSNIGQVGLLVLSLDGVSLTEDGLEDAQ